METFILNEDIKVFTMTAESFPEGILESHQKLHAIVPFSTDRRYFGVSRPENSVITYKAAAEELEGEEGKYELDSLIIKKGRYISLVISGYMKDEQAIAKAFEKLLAYPDIDPDGYCVEWYISDDDVRCMIRLED